MKTLLFRSADRSRFKRRSRSLRNKPDLREVRPLSWRPLSSLDYKYPNGQDRRQSSQAADGPARRVNLTVRSRPVHQLKPSIRAQCAKEFI